MPPVEWDALLSAITSRNSGAYEAALFGFHVSRSQECFDPINRFRSRSNPIEIALPNAVNKPTFRQEVCLLFSVALDVAPQLRHPGAVLAVPLDHAIKFATVPEIAVDEYGKLLSRFCDIGLAGCALVMTPEGHSAQLELGEGDQLRFRVLRTNTRHEPGSLCGIKEQVGHISSLADVDLHVTAELSDGLAILSSACRRSEIARTSKRGNLYNYVDLFAGCGGLSLGIERSGGRLQLAVEKSDMAAQTFYANFIDDSISGESWKRYVAESVTEQAARGVAVAPLRSVLDDPATISALLADGVDVVVGGPPCQGFSLAGRRNPDDVRNKLPWEYLEFVEMTAPKLVVIENVVGMNHKFAKDEEAPFVQLQQALRETLPGYEVQGVAVNALHYGAPQNRPRLMIIGLRKDVAKERGVYSTGEIWRSGFRDEIDLDAIPPLAPEPTVTRAESPTIADAIGDLQGVFPPSHTKRAAAIRKATRTKVDWGLPKGKPRSGPIANQTPRVHTDATRQRFRLYQWLRDNDLQPRLLSELSKSGESGRAHVEHVLRKATFPAVAPDGGLLAQTPEEMVELMVTLKTKKHTQKALAWESPARTVVTLPDDYVHPSEPRIFTVREMARFQGFPDDFEFRGKETTGSLRRRFEVPQYSQVGNAVSPFLALAVGRMIDRVIG